MTNQLENQIASYQRWREDIRSGIEAYQAWLDQHGHVDIQRSLRIYDLLESLRNDRMVLAFLAEYSRGKTELINAMFFSDFKQRLLPSDVGRTTMCPDRGVLRPRGGALHPPAADRDAQARGQHRLAQAAPDRVGQDQAQPAVAGGDGQRHGEPGRDQAGAGRGGLRSGADRPEGLRDHHRGHARQQGRDSGVAPRDDQLSAPAAQERAGDPRHARPERAGHRARAHAQDDSRARMPSCSCSPWTPA